MKIIEPGAEVLTPFGPLTQEVGIKLLQFIERMARISHRSEDRQTDDSWRKFIEAVVLGHGDWSVCEHASVTVLARTDRGISHEWVRHRILSITQESTRFVRYGKNEKDLEFIKPSEMKDNLPDGFLWRNSIGESERTYLDLLKEGVRPQEARSVLPNSLATTLALTTNLRNWRHIFLMRTSKESHPDFKRLTIPLLAEFQKTIPLLFDDITPDTRQIENMRKPR
jgi:thymidylate synthase (FAD)